MTNDPSIIHTTIEQSVFDGLRDGRDAIRHDDDAFECFSSAAGRVARQVWTREPGTDRVTVRIFDEVRL